MLEYNYLLNRFKKYLEHMRNAVMRICLQEPFYSKICLHTFDFLTSMHVYLCVTNWSVEETDYFQNICKKSLLTYLSAFL